MKKMLINGLLLVTATGFLAACEGSVKDTLGFRRGAPDEFRVVSNPPLSVPPEFTLRPPVNSKGYKQDPTSEEGARRVLFEQASADMVMPAEESNTSESEAAFLNGIGAGSADPSIKELLRQDAENEAQLEEKKDGFFSRISKLSSPDGAEDEPVVNAMEEKKRIGDNMKQGKPITEGETPVIEKKDEAKTGLLNRWFGI